MRQNIVALLAKTRTMLDDNEFLLRTLELGRKKVPGADAALDNVENSLRNLRVALLEARKRCPARMRVAFKKVPGASVKKVL